MSLSLMAVNKVDLPACEVCNHKHWSVSLLKKERYVLIRDKCAVHLLCTNFSSVLKIQMLKLVYGNIIIDRVGTKVMPQDSLYTKPIVDIKYP